MGIEFDTSLPFEFVYSKSAYEAIYSGTQYRYFLCQTNINDISTFKCGAS